MNRLEKLIQYVSPERAARRARARVQMSVLEAAKSYYDGADLGRRGASIRRSGASAETISARTLPSLRNGSHDLVRNNPHARRGVEAIVSNTIGAGIIPRFKRGKETDTALQDYIRDTLDTTRLDAGGQLDYYGTQSLICRTMVESGEALVIRRYANDPEFPLRVSVLEPDFLDSSRDTDGLSDGGRIIQGVQYNANGSRAGYWLFDEHPGSRLRSVSSTFWPARDVAHIYRIERPGQVRGIPWLAPVMLRLADFSDYEEAQLMRQKIAACYAVFVNDAIESVPTKPGATAAERETEVEPGMIVRTQPGSQTTFGQPPQILDYKDYAKVSLRAIAAGLNISYEALTGDLESVNFSSGRMGWLEFQRNIDSWRWLTIIPQGLNVIMGWFLDAAELAGLDTQGVQVRHSPPAREMIAPEREVPAKVNALKSGQKTLRQIVEQDSGRDLEEHLDEMREVNEMLEERGLSFDALVGNESDSQPEDLDDE